MRQKNAELALLENARHLPYREGVTSARQCDATSEIETTEPENWPLVGMDISRQLERHDSLHRCVPSSRYNVFNAPICAAVRVNRYPEVASHQHCATPQRFFQQSGQWSG